MTNNIKIENLDDLINLFGDFDSNIKQLKNAFNVEITQHGNSLNINGSESDVKLCSRAINSLLMRISAGEIIDQQTTDYAVSMVLCDNDDKTDLICKADCVCITSTGKPVKPKTLGQQRYVEAIEKNTVTIGVGPAGTGKTHLAVAMAVNAYRKKKVSRIILTRPAVEAGEKLGFLPGDLQQKVDPYLRPLYDGLFEMLGAEAFNRCLERGDIEVAPLAYMRGRTLDDSFIILDEAQNTTNEQMKMFLTRLGFNSKIVVTGDITQIDLPDGRCSGLKTVVKVLKDVKDIAVIVLDNSDIVRHHLVQKIINAYEKYESRLKND